MPATYPLRLVGRKEERRILFHEYYDPAGISVCEWPSHLLLLLLLLTRTLFPCFPHPDVTTRSLRDAGAFRFFPRSPFPSDARSRILSRHRARARPHITNTTISFSLVFSFSLPPVVDTATSFARVPRTRLIFYGCQAGSLPP